VIYETQNMTSFTEASPFFLSFSEYILDIRAFFGDMWGIVACRCYHRLGRVDYSVEANSRSSLNFVEA